MRVDTSQDLISGKREIIITLSESHIVQHLESRFEKEARQVFEKTQKISDMLFYFSEWAKTEEEKQEKEDTIKS